MRVELESIRTENQHQFFVNDHTRGTIIKKYVDKEINFKQ